ncbi:MAG: phenylacetic acid degradation-like protein, partial [Sphingomonas bacterium]|nr:phenylacetic acid degradation-like protein [Sphingomonas bacterium]
AARRMAGDEIDMQVRACDRPQPDQRPQPRGKLDRVRRARQHVGGAGIEQGGAATGIDRAIRDDDRQRRRGERARAPAARPRPEGSYIADTAHVIARRAAARYRARMVEHIHPAAEGLDVAAAATLIAGHGHNGAIGARYLRHGEDWAELAIDYRDDLVGNAETGVLASGPIIALMDMATSVAVWVRRGHFLPQATLDLRIDYLRAATPGLTVIGHGECYRLTRRIAFVRGFAHDGDAADPIAHVVGTFMMTDAE